MTDDEEKIWEALSRQSDTIEFLGKALVKVEGRVHSTRMALSEMMIALAVCSRFVPMDSKAAEEVKDSIARAANHYREAFKDES